MNCNFPCGQIVLLVPWLGHAPSVSEARNSVIRAWTCLCVQPLSERILCLLLGSLIQWAAQVTAMLPDYQWADGVVSL